MLNTIAREGHMYWMLCNTVCRFIKLKILLASTRIIPSIRSYWYIFSSYHGRQLLLPFQSSNIQYMRVWCPANCFLNIAFLLFLWSWWLLFMWGFHLFWRSKLMVFFVFVQLEVHLGIIFWAMDVFFLDFSLFLVLMVKYHNHCFSSGTLVLHLFSFKHQFCRYTFKVSCFLMFLRC